MPILAVSAAVLAGLMRPNWCVAGIYSAGNPIGRDEITAPVKKAFAGRQFPSSIWGSINDSHVDAVASSIVALGYQVDKSQDLLKADAPGLIRDRLVWYTLSDGALNRRTNFYGVVYSHSDQTHPWEVFTPNDVPTGQHYVFVFLNACMSAQPNITTPQRFRIAFGAPAYLGWRKKINPETAAGFAERFFSNLKGKKTVAQAVNQTINSYGPISIAKDEIVGNIWIMPGGEGTVVEQ
jgi:hypothetical protein